MPWVEAEKPELVATLRSADPDAPTLCAGWTVRHLLAHLVQREQVALGGLGDLVVRRPPGQEKFQGRLVDGARTPDGYRRLLDRFAAGPSRWSPMSWAADSLNFLEYLIHHEDVRRGGDQPAGPRDLPAKEQQSIWKRLSLPARLGVRRAPTGVTLATVGGNRQQVRKGPDGVTITGDPLELLLHVTGRRRAAQVDISGPPEAVDRFTTWLRTT